LSVSGLEYIVGFFHQIYERYQSEAIVLLLWDLQRRRYRICVPPQKPTVWESSYGTRVALDVSYEVPLPLPRGCIVAASIHSHADGDAYSSWTDRDDERYRDGVHVVCGRVHRKRPEFHCELVVDGHRFDLQFDDFFRGFKRRRTRIPRKWLETVKCVVKRPKWYWSDSLDTRDYSYDNRNAKGRGDDAIS
jgi:proteasome lid subunit RPN8/RPN11